MTREHLYAHFSHNEPTRIDNLNNITITHKLTSVPFCYLRGTWELVVQFLPDSSCSYGVQWSEVTDLDWLELKFNRFQLKMISGEVESCLVISNELLKMSMLDEESKCIRKNLGRRFSGTKSYDLFLEVSVILLDEHTARVESIEGSMCMEALYLQPSNDVHFIFPKEQKSLWASSAVLRAASSYFDGLLNPSFSEGKKTSSSSTKRVDVLHENSTNPESDFGRDEELRSTIDQAESDQRSLDHPIPHHTIEINYADFNTVKACIHWIYTNKISFTSPRSKKLLQTASDSKDNATRPSYPTASPKSVIPLANYFGLEYLQGLARECLEENLTVETVAYEMYSELAGLYPDVRRVILKFAADNWDEVKYTKAWKEMKSKVDAGDVPFAASISMDLLEKLQI